MTQDHYDYRLRVNPKKTQPEAATLMFLKGTGNATLPEGYRVVLALQAFYGTEAAVAANSPTTRQTALESIGLLLEQCATIADQAGIDLDSLTTEPAVMSDLLRQAAERLDPLRRSRKRVSIKENGSPVASNGKQAVIADTSPAPVARAADPPVVTSDPAPAETPPSESKPKRQRMF